MFFRLLHLPQQHTLSSASCLMFDCHQFIMNLYLLFSYQNNSVTIATNEPETIVIIMLIIQFNIQQYRGFTNAVLLEHFHGICSFTWYFHKKKRNIALAQSIIMLVITLQLSINLHKVRKHISLHTHSQYTTTIRG